MIDSCVDYSTRAIPIVPFVDASFHKLVFSPILPPQYHVILHAGLVRSCRTHILKSEEKPSPMGRVASQGGWGYEKMFLSGLQPISATIPHLQDDEGYLLDMDSATSP